jgi:hypothetical protein
MKKHRMEMSIPRSMVDAAINSQKGKIFTIEFVKKNGEYRRMNCRKGVTKHLKGGENPLRYGNNPELRIVFDMQKKEYRMVNLDTARKLIAGGIVHHIES